MTCLFRLKNILLKIVKNDPFDISGALRMCMVLKLCVCKTTEYKAMVFNLIQVGTLDPYSNVSNKRTVHFYLIS